MHFTGLPYAWFFSTDCRKSKSSLKLSTYQLLFQTVEPSGISPSETDDLNTTIAVYLCHPPSSLLPCRHAQGLGKQLTQRVGSGPPCWALSCTQGLSSAPSSQGAGHQPRTLHPAAFPSLSRADQRPRWSTGSPHTEAGPGPACTPAAALRTCSGLLSASLRGPR